jgi:hypothetical protein
MKIHAILSKPELQDIIAWDDHGRSFRWEVLHRVFSLS